jgi:hypothetical protein
MHRHTSCQASPQPNCSPQVALPQHSGLPEVNAGKRPEALMKPTEGRGTTAADGSTETHRAARGFAGMDPVHVRMLASRGGKAAHEQGVAHEFTV